MEQVMNFKDLVF